MKSILVLPLVFTALQVSATPITYKTKDACTNAKGEAVLTVSSEIVKYDPSNDLLFPIEKCTVPRAPQYPGDSDCETAVQSGWIATKQIEILSAKLQRGGRTVGIAPILMDMTASADPAAMPTSFEGITFKADREHGIFERTFSNHSWFYELADGTGLPGFNSPATVDSVSLKVVNGQLSPLTKETREAILKDFARDNKVLSLFIDDCKTVPFEQQ